MELRHRLLYAVSSNVDLILYGCEAWTLPQTLMDKTGSCEMWLLRLMGKISWEQKTKTADVLKDLKTEKNTSKHNKSKETQNIWATANAEIQLSKNILEGKKEGREDHEAGHGLSGAITS